MQVSILRTIAALVVASLVGAAPASGGVAIDRFAQVHGPLADAVLTPDELGVDATRVPVAIGPLVARVDGARLRATVEEVAVPRGPDAIPVLKQLAADLADELASYGYDVHQDPVVSPVFSDPDTGEPASLPNVWVELPGTSCAERLFVVGAHYDSAGNPGADDNATGVAGVLELARVLRDTPLAATVRFALFPWEEVGFSGSAATLLHLPDFPAASAVLDPRLLPGILASDHRSFLVRGWPALMATDTAYYRNPNYHDPTDTVETLDFGFLWSAVQSVLSGVVTFASVESGADGTPDVCGVSEETPPAAPPAVPIARTPRYTG